MSDEAPPPEEAPPAEAEAAPAPAEEAPAAAEEPAAAVEEPAAAEGGEAAAPVEGGDVPAEDAPPPAEGAPVEEAAGGDAAPAPEAAVPEGEAAPVEGGDGSPPAEGGEEGGGAGAEAEGDAPAAEEGEQPPAAALVEEEEEEEVEEEEEDDDDDAMDMAQGAPEIEGFEDDFLEDTLDVEISGMMDGTPDMPEMDDDAATEGPDVDALLHEAAEEKEKLLAMNAAMSRKLLSLLQNLPSKKATGDVKMVDGGETRYHQSIQNWSELREDLKKQEAHYDTVTFEMKAQLEERMAKADDIRSAYRAFKSEVATSSEHSRTGKPISEKLIEQMELQEVKKEEDVNRVRIKNIHLRNQMRKLEEQIKQKEELAEGLHLIDFEQLKIENQSLNEKIEERNEELLKLRKKTTTTVQVLTHFKEKLQFVQKENEVLERELTGLESELAARRDALQRVKRERDVLKGDNQRLKANSGVVTNDLLVEDMEQQKERRDELGEKLRGLRDRHVAVTQSVGRQKERLAGMSTGLLSATGPMSPGAPSPHQQAAMSAAM